MRFGAFLLATRFPGESDTAALHRTVEAAIEAERAGFDDVWLAEHHFMSYGVCPSAVTLAAYVLAATENINVGTAVTVLSTQHPVAVAEQAAMLAAVSGGRFRLGVGRGGPWRDLEVFGTGLRRYEDGFEESLDLLLTWLNSPKVAWEGAHFAFREVPVVPRTSDPPPVVVACTSENTETLAAQRGLPMLLGMHVGNAEKAAAVARYNTIHQAQPAHIAAGVAQVADTRKAAVRLVRREMPRWLAPGLAGFVPVDDRPRNPRDPTAYARELCDRHAVGDPTDCITALTATAQQTGITHQILLVEAAGSRDHTLENIARLGAEVLPQARTQARTQARQALKQEDYR